MKPDLSTNTTQENELKNDMVGLECAPKLATLIMYGLKEVRDTTNLNKREVAIQELDILFDDLIHLFTERDEPGDKEKIQRAHQLKAKLIKFANLSAN